MTLAVAPARPAEVTLGQGPWIEGGPPIRKSLNCAGGFAFPEKSAGTSQAAGAVEGAAADGAIGPEDVPAVYSTPSTVQTADSGDLLLNIQDLGNLMK